MVLLKLKRVKFGFILLLAVGFTQGSFRLRGGNAVRQCGAVEFGSVACVLGVKSALESSIWWK